MSKKTFIGIYGLCHVYGLAASASAECDGFYMGVRGGIVNHNVGDSDEALGDRLEVDDNAWMAGVALGYRYTYFRAELEYTWREETDKATGEIDARNHSNFSDHVLHVKRLCRSDSLLDVYALCHGRYRYDQHSVRISGGFGRRSVKYEEDNFYLGRRRRSRQADQPYQH